MLCQRKSAVLTSLPLCVYILFQNEWQPWLIQPDVCQDSMLQSLDAGCWRRLFARTFLPHGLEGDMEWACRYTGKTVRNRRMWYIKCRQDGGFYFIYFPAYIRIFYIPNWCGPKETVDCCLGFCETSLRPFLLILHNLRKRLCKGPAEL